MSKVLPAIRVRPQQLAVTSLTMPGATTIDGMEGPQTSFKSIDPTLAPSCAGCGPKPG